jgi:ribosomal protein L37AE/L43A
VPPAAVPHLVVHACRSACRWSRTRRLRAGRSVFACAGCGSQWDAGQAWTPVDADGRVPADVRAERRGGTDPGEAGDFLSL